MDDCLFCRIAAGSIPSAEVYQDEAVFAFLDINPLAPGHTLVVTKRHAARLQDCSPEDASALLRAAHLLAPSIAKVTGLPDATIAINNGPGAGQEVQHVHLHLVPRRAGDGHGPIHALFRPPSKADVEQLHDTAIRLQRELERRSVVPGVHRGA